MHQYGIQVFDLSVEQICSLLENAGPDKGKHYTATVVLRYRYTDTTSCCRSCYAAKLYQFYLLFLGIDHAKLGATPTVQYQVMGGGRFFPSVSREVSTIDCQWIKLHLLW